MQESLRKLRRLLSLAHCNRLLLLRRRRLPVLSNKKGWLVQFTFLTMFHSV